MPIYLNAIDLVDDPELGVNPYTSTRKERDTQPAPTLEERQREIKQEDELIKNMLTRWAREDMERFPYEEDD